MRIIKIGRAGTNDLIVSNNIVSSEHAKITVLDNGQVTIKDLNSKNGTFLNGKKIQIEVPIKHGDEIKVANEIINWEVLIKNNDVDKHKKTIISGNINPNIKTIGRDSNSDIVIPNSDVSSSHATLIRNSNDIIEIRDNNSTNGVYVNGERVNNKQLNIGDKILLCNKYILEWEKIFSPIEKIESKKNKKTFIIAASIIATAIIMGAVLYLAPHDEKNAPWAPEKIYSTYKKSVVLVVHVFQFVVTTGDEVLGKYGIEDGEVVENGYVSITGTGFFVSPDGKIVTNRHVALPWKYQKDIEKKIKEYWQNQIITMSKKNPYLQKYVNDIKVEGQTYKLGVLINDTYFNSETDIHPVTLVKESGNDDIDVALIQTNSKSTPNGIDHVVNANNIHNKEDIKEGMVIYSIGFPAGFELARTKTGLKANCQDGKVTQSRDETEFGHNITIIGGASGSPVFDECGRLAGVIHQGYTGSQGYNMAVYAKHISELLK